MDCGLIVDGEGSDLRVRTLPMADVKTGMNVVCGASGIKVASREPPEGSGFGFMESEVSSEKPQAVMVRQVASGMREAKESGKKVLWVGGPGVVHTGRTRDGALVEAGYVDVLFAGNALATHDIDSALYGSSLASTSPWGAASNTATSTISARSTRSARPGRSRPRSSRAC